MRSQVYNPLVVNESDPFAWVYIRRRCRLTQEVVVMNRNVLFAMGLILLAPAAWAQTAAKLDPGSASQVIRAITGSGSLISSSLISRRSSPPLVPVLEQVDVGIPYPQL
jgi:hypothetical protein